MSMKKRRHRPEEIAVKLRQADEMVAGGKLHSEVAAALGVSIMTYHRWRKARAAAGHTSSGSVEARAHPAEGDLDARISALQIENSRLRRLVTDLLLEKIGLEETLGGKKSGTSGE
jgi:putative transposase